MKGRKALRLQTIVFSALVIVLITVIGLRVICRPAEAAERYDGYEQQRSVLTALTERDTARIKSKLLGYHNALISAVPPKMPVIEPEEQTAAEYTEDDLYCLAAAIYQEAGSDYIFDDCRFRVGDVIVNRVRVAVEQTAAEYTEDDLYCLAAAIYQEAGSDYICDECRFRVGDVIVNRVADPRFPDTIRDVLEAPGQYGLFAVTGVCFPDKAYTEEEAAAVERAYETAKALLTDEHHSELYGAGYVWQAEFKQGTDIVYCDNTYFGR